ncbi:MAG: hypothetical protein IAF38_01215, partial [Bacteroidia bacterium]|nr:hypothetical protein [Bacteroidia bacterium]
MKKFKLLIALALFSGFAFAQTHVEWEKDNFPGKKDEFKTAKKFFEEGKDLFDKGKKEQEAQIQWTIKTFNHYPNSRADLKGSGNE